MRRASCKSVYTHEKLVVHGLDDDLLGGVLRNVESQLEALVVALVLDQRTVQAVQPVGVVVLGTDGARVVARLCRRAVKIRQVPPLVDQIHFDSMRDGGRMIDQATALRSIFEQLTRTYFHSKN